MVTTLSKTFVILNSKIQPCTSNKKQIINNVHATNNQKHFKFCKIIFKPYSIFVSRRADVNLQYKTDIFDNWLQVTGYDLLLTSSGTILKAGAWWNLLKIYLCNTKQLPFKLCKQICHGSKISETQNKFINSTGRKIWTLFLAQHVITQL